MWLASVGISNFFSLLNITVKRVSAGRTISLYVVLLQHVYVYVCGVSR